MTLFRRAKIFATACAFILAVLPAVVFAQVSDMQQKARREVYKALADKKITASEMGAYIEEINKGDDAALLAMRKLEGFVPPAETPSASAGTPEVKITYTRSAVGRNARTAVWIEDSSGRYIKTLYRSVGGTINPFPVHLLKWEKAAGKISDNQPDAYTGATYSGGSSGSTYTFTWDCRNSFGSLVPDGEYVYKVENARYYAPPLRPQSNISSGRIKKGAVPDKSEGDIDNTPPALLSSLSAEFRLKKAGESEKPPLPAAPASKEEKPDNFQ